MMKKTGTVRRIPDLNEYIKSTFFHHPHKKSIGFRLVVVMALSIGCMLPFVLRALSKGSLQGIPFWWLGFGLLTILLAAGMYVILFRWTLPRLSAYSKGWKILWGTGVLLAGFWLSLNIPLRMPSVEFLSLPPLLGKLLYNCSAGLGLGLILFVLSAWLVTLPLPEQVSVTKPRRWRSIIYAIPMMAVWFVYLLAFYPGMMSADSMNQWGQVLSGNYVDHHPVFHTLMIWLVTRIAFTPVAVAVVQIIMLALVAGSWLAFFEQIGVRQWIIWVTMAGFALTPVNGTMVNTLWKDVPYSISVLALTLVIGKIVFSNGKWINAGFSRVLAGITIALVLLFRHDGLPVGLGALGFLFLAYPTRWKSWLITCLVCLGIYFGVRGPVYQWIGVKKSTALAEATLSLYPIAAYAMPGTNTASVLNSISLSDWDCSVWEQLNPDWRDTDLDSSIHPVQLASNLVQRVPKILLYFYRCQRSMEWIIWDPNGEVRNASHVQLLVDKNKFGIEHDSKLPVLRDWVARWVTRTSQDNDLNWLFWRPALYLYIHLFIVAIIILRNKNLRFISIAAPVVIQSITFSLIFALPNFRYHYAVYLVSLISLPFLLSPMNKDEAKTQIIPSEISTIDSG